MANEQLNDYIQKARQSGLSDEQIKSELLKAGWSQADIDSAIQANKYNQQQVDTPGIIASVSLSRDAGNYAFPYPNQLIRESFGITKKLWKLYFFSVLRTIWPVWLLILTLASYAIATFVAKDINASDNAINIVRIIVGLVGLVSVVLILLRSIRFPIVSYLVIKHYQESLTSKEIYRRSGKLLWPYYWTVILAFLYALLYTAIILFVFVLAPYALISFTATALELSKTIVEIVRTVIGFMGIIVLITVPTATFVFLFFPLIPSIIETGIKGKDAVINSKKLSKGFKWMILFHATVRALIQRLPAVATYLIGFLLSLLIINNDNLVARVISGAIFLLVILTVILVQLLFFGPLVTTYHVFFYRYIVDAKNKGVAKSALPLKMKILAVFLVIIILLLGLFSNLFGRKSDGEAVVPNPVRSVNMNHLTNENIL